MKDKIFHSSLIIIKIYKRNLPVGKKSLAANKVCLLFFLIRCQKGIQSAYCIQVIGLQKEKSVSKVWIDTIFQSDTQFVFLGLRRLWMIIELRKWSIQKEILWSCIRASWSKSLVRFITIVWQPIHIYHHLLLEIECGRYYLWQI